MAAGVRGAWLAEEGGSLPVPPRWHGEQGRQCIGCSATPCSCMVSLELCISAGLCGYTMIWPFHPISSQSNGHFPFFVCVFLLGVIFVFGVAMLTVYTAWSTVNPSEAKG